MFFINAFLPATHEEYDMEFTAATKEQKYGLYIGSIYEHYKGKKYKVLDVVWNAESDELEPLVIYQGLYDDPKLGPSPKFARSVSRFLEKIIINNECVDRFRYFDQVDTTTTAQK